VKDHSGECSGYHAKSAKEKAIFKDSDLFDALGREMNQDFKDKPKSRKLWAVFLAGGIVAVLEAMTEGE
jgi:hypothetical protein